MGSAQRRRNCLNEASRLAPLARSSKDATPRTPNVMVGRPEIVERSIGGDDEIGLQPVAVLAHEIGDMRAADFLLALQQEDDVARQFAMHRQMRFDRQDLGEVLALVVADAARIDAAVADRGLEGRADPGVQRVRRLHVIMAVEQHRRRAGLLLPPCRAPSGGSRSARPPLPCPSRSACSTRRAATSAMPMFCALMLGWRT